MAVSTIKKSITKTNSYNYYCVYPTGKTYGTDTTRVVIPFLNPDNISPTLGEVYVYDSNGNFNQITGCAITTWNNVATTISVPFNSSYAGRLMRIGIS